MIEFNIRAYHAINHCHYDLSTAPSEARVLGEEDEHDQEGETDV